MKTASTETSLQPHVPALPSQASLDPRAARVAGWCVQLGVGLRAAGETLVRRPDADAAVWRNAWCTRSTWKRGW